MERRLECLERKKVCAYGNQSSAKVLMSDSEPATEGTTSGTSRNSWFRFKFLQQTNLPTYQGSLGKQPHLPTNMNYDDLAVKQKHPKVNALASGISIRHPILSLFFCTRLGGIFMRPDKVVDRAGRQAGCRTH